MKANATLIARKIFFIVLGFSIQTAYANFWQDLGSSAKISFGFIATFARWSNSGKYIAVGGATGSTSAAIYKWEHGNTIKDLGPTAKVNFGSFSVCAAWSPNSKFIAIGGVNHPTDLIVYEWDSNTNSLIDLGASAKKSCGNQAYAAAWSPDGKYLAVGQDNGSTDLIVYRWDNGNTLTDLGSGASKDFGSFAYSVNWSPNGKYLAVGGKNGTTDVIVYQWDSATNTLIDLGANAKKDHGYAAYSVVWSPDGKYLAVGGQNGTTDVIIYQWNTATNSLVDLGANAQKDHGSFANSIAWCNGSKYLAIGGLNGTTDVIFYQWDGLNLTTISSIDFGSQALTVSWSPNTKFFVCAGQNSPYNVAAYYSPYTFTLNGNEQNIDLTWPYIFHDYKNSAGGIVKFENGFTVLSDANAYLDLDIPISSGIDLRGTGELILSGDLYLDSTCTLSGGGIIAGQGHTIFLQGDLLLPATSPSVIHITSDTVIDGQNNDMILDHQCYFLVDNNVTLTLKHLTLKNPPGAITPYPIQLFGPSSRLALDDVTFALNGNFTFSQGQLFFHNDVIVSGTSQCVYASPQPSYITQQSILMVDHQASFSYGPISSNNRQLIKMFDQSSQLYLNGCTVQSTTTGLQLTKGTLLCNGKSYIYNQDNANGAAKSLSQAIALGDGDPEHDLEIIMYPGASLNVKSGILDYRNSL
jgi:WD40 repeat protein